MGYRRGEEQSEESSPSVIPSIYMDVISCIQAWCCSLMMVFSSDTLSRYLIHASLSFSLSLSLLLFCLAGDDSWTLSCRSTQTVYNTSTDTDPRISVTPTIPIPLTILFTGQREGAGEGPGTRSGCTPSLHCS